jgi:hypothetical protein
MHLHPFVNSRATVLTNARHPHPIVTTSAPFRPSTTSALDPPPHRRYKGCKAAEWELSSTRCPTGLLRATCATSSDSRPRREGTARTPTTTSLEWSSFCPVQRGSPTRLFLSFPCSARGRTLSCMHRRHLISTETLPATTRSVHDAHVGRYLPTRSQTTEDCVCASCTRVFSRGVCA